MLDIRKIKENPDAVKAGLKAKEVDCDAVVDRILVLDTEIRALKTASEGRTAQKNKIAKENGKLFGQKKGMEKKGEDTSALDAQIEANKAESIALDAANEADTAKLKELSVEFKTAMLSLPNLPDADLLPAARKTTSLCATSVKSTTLTLNLSTMLTCARIWASLTTSAVSSWPAPATGCTPVWAPVWSGHC